MSRNCHGNLLGGLTEDICQLSLDSVSRSRWMCNVARLNSWWGFQHLPVSLPAAPHLSQPSCKVAHLSRQQSSFSEDSRVWLWWEFFVFFWFDNTLGALANDIQQFVELLGKCIRPTFCVFGPWIFQKSAMFPLHNICKPILPAFTQLVP